jgi:predicted molibdopterin-dependent oxidoreductase YjgC
VKVLKTTKKLPVKLNDDEMLERGKMLVENMRKTAVAEEERDKENKKRKGDIALLEGVTARIAETVRSGSEYREVECELRKDYERGTVATFRDDTGEQIDQRPMTAEERQEDMFEPKAPRHPAKGAGEDPFAEGGNAP